MVEVVKVDYHKRPQQGFPGAGIEKAYVQPVKTCKGSVAAVPKSVEIHLSGTTCEGGVYRLHAGTKPLVFVAPAGALLLTVEPGAPYSKYDETVGQVEKLGR